VATTEFVTHLGNPRAPHQDLDHHVVLCVRCEQHLVHATFTRSFVDQRRRLESAQTTTNNNNKQGIEEVGMSEQNKHWHWLPQISRKILEGVAGVVWGLFVNEDLPWEDGLAHTANTISFQHIKLVDLCISYRRTHNSVEAVGKKRTRTRKDVRHGK